MTIPREVGQMALDNLESLAAYIQGGEPDLVMQVPAIEALRTALAAKEPEPVGNTITFMTRAIFNMVADHQEINGGYFIADSDVAAFVDRLAKVINSTFEPLKYKNEQQKPEQEPVAWMDAHDSTNLYYRKPPQGDVIPLYFAPPKEIK